MGFLRLVFHGGGGLDPTPHLWDLKPYWILKYKVFHSRSIWPIFSEYVKNIHIWSKNRFYTVETITKMQLLIPLSIMSCRIVIKPDVLRFDAAAGRAMLYSSALIQLRMRWCFTRPRGLNCLSLSLKTKFPA